MADLGETVEQTVKRIVIEETSPAAEKPERALVDNVEFDRNGKLKYHFVIARALHLSKLEAENSNQ